MSGSVFEDFVDELAANGQLQEDLYGLADDDDMIEFSDVVQFANSHGYEFAAEEFDTELSDADLESIAGGVSPVLPKLEIQLSSSNLDSQFIKIDVRDGALFLKFF